MDDSGFFESREWEENPFHVVEVQICGKTQTVQLGFVDNSGDCHRSEDNPAGVALTFQQWRQLSNWARTMVLEAEKDEPPHLPSD